MTHTAKEESVLNALRQAGGLATLDQICQYTPLERTDVLGVLLDESSKSNGKVQAMYNVYRLTD
jgi:hypothetical protein